MSDTEIQHQQTATGGSFIANHDGVRAGELTYARDGESIVAEHTFVDPAFRGGTVARDLLAAIVALARSEHRRIVPQCAYVRGAFERHAADYADVAAS